MNATGTLVATGKDKGHAGVGPTVMLDGRPWFGAWVRRLRAEGPLDQREAELVLERQRGGWDERELERLRQLSGRTVALLQPLAFAGGESTLMVLMHGRLGSMTQTLNATQDELTITLRCDWSHQLERTVNPSAAQRWAVGDLVAQLNVETGAQLDTGLLDQVVRDAAVPSNVVRANDLGAMLNALCDAYDLCVRQTLTWRGQQVQQRVELRRAAHGRPLRLPRRAVAGRGGVEAITASLEEPRPIRLTAEGAYSVVESTFTLMPGWGAENIALDDSAYAKVTSESFEAVANVFRLWVLNEDGAFDGEPFDVAAFFDEGRTLPSEALRFGSTLTQDSAGGSLGVVVEVSTDAGETWSRRGGVVTVLNDRAGVYLEDDVLPTAWLTAVRAGEARLRVTATLRNPLPMEAVRWHGNAFVGEFIDRRFALANLFAHRRIAPESRYHTAVRGGDVTADEVDDRQAMAAWLINQSGRLNDGRGLARVRTTGVMLAMNAGDRLTHIGSRAVDGVGGGGQRLAIVEHRWDRQRTDLTLEGVN
ncbi:MAG: hypothetical protein WD294_10440 [Phycisphaeraceae bacterium]